MRRRRRVCILTRIHLLHHIIDLIGFHVETCWVMTSEAPLLPPGGLETQQHRTPMQTSRGP